MVFFRPRVFSLREFSLYNLSTVALCARFDEGIAFLLQIQMIQLALCGGECAKTYLAHTWEADAAESVRKPTLAHTWEVDAVRSVRKPALTHTWEAEVARSVRKPARTRETW